MKAARSFLYSAGFLLALTAIAKLVSSFGDDATLDTSDPLLKIPFRYLFKYAGIVELAVAAVCIFGRRPRLQFSLLCLLSTIFLGYRIGLHWVGYDGPCDCLGSLTEAIHIPSGVADKIMKGILAYLLIGGYAGLIVYWRSKIAAPE